MIESDRSPEVWPPGTVRIENVCHSHDRINLVPKPTRDPNDPLNWSRWRKNLNMSIVCFYVFWTFVQLDVGLQAWQLLKSQLGFTFFVLNASVAVNYLGLAIGCVLFIPLVHKYGRRPLYIFSNALQLASCIWQAETWNAVDFLGSNLLSGLGGAISETIVQITIADIYFVHEHGTANGWYLLATTVGATLGPVASGYITDSQGWRWVWWYCVIFIGLLFVATLFLYEETKYIPNQRLEREITNTQYGTAASAASQSPTPSSHHSRTPSEEPILPHSTKLSRIDPSVPLKTYRQRLAFFTPTKGPIAHHFYQPFTILLTFPAVTYTAITFGSMLALFAVMTSIQADYLPKPPYNFSASGVGLMNLAPFIGTVLGFGIGGWLNDKLMLLLARRNGGIYEPEMRLWIALPSILVGPAGIAVFGIGLAHGMHWIVLAVGYAIFSVGMIVATAAALSYCQDAYQDVIGDALTGIVFVRNIVSVVVLAVLDDWVDAMGVQGVHIVSACVAVGILCLPIAMLKWGKRTRLWTADRYKSMALKQPTQRTFSA